MFETDENSIFDKLQTSYFTERTGRTYVVIRSLLTDFNVEKDFWYYSQQSEVVLLLNDW